MVTVWNYTCKQYWELMMKIVAASAGLQNDDAGPAADDLVACCDRACTPCGLWHCHTVSAATLPAPAPTSKKKLALSEFLEALSSQAASDESHDSSESCDSRRHGVARPQSAYTTHATTNAATHHATGSTATVNCTGYTGDEPVSSYLYEPSSMPEEKGWIARVDHHDCDGRFW